MNVPSILIIEDHKDFREAMKNFILMKDQQVRVLEAAAGQEGIDVALREHPKVVIIDVQLGTGMNGLEAAAIIKRNDPSCGIIILTMYAAQSMRDYCKGKDVEDIIDKSDLDVRLIPAISRLLGSRLPKDN